MIGNVKVGIIMGSDSDWPSMQKATVVLKDFSVPFEVHVMSAHRTPELVTKFATEAESRGLKVIIAAAGMAAHLAGVVAGHTILPVIGVPCKGGVMDGLDALLATVQMPSGIPVATVALNGSVNAALLAVQILATSDETLRLKLHDYKAEMAAKIEKANAKIKEQL